MTTTGTIPEVAQAPVCRYCGKPMNPHTFKMGGSGWVCECGATEMPAPVGSKGGKKPKASKKQTEFTKRAKKD